MNVLKKQRGAALIMSLMLIALLGVFTLSYFSLSKNSLQATTALKNSLRAGAAAESELGKNSSEILNSRLESLPSSDFLRLQKLSGGFLKLSTFGISQHALAHREVLMRDFQATPLALPDWSVLMSHSDAACNDWAIDSKTSRIQCTNIHGDLTNNSCLWGDYNSPAVLMFSDRTEETIRIVVVGAFTLDKGISVDHVGATRIEIYTVSDLNIANIAVSVGSNLELLLHSSRGKVVLKSAPKAELFCAGAPGSSRIRIEGFQGISLGTSVLSSNTFGCELAKDSRVWPNRKIIGGAHL